MPQRRRPAQDGRFAGHAADGAGPADADLRRTERARSGPGSRREDGGRAAATDGGGRRGQRGARPVGPRGGEPQLHDVTGDPRRVHRAGRPATRDLEPRLPVPREARRRPRIARCRRPAKAAPAARQGAGLRPRRDHAGVAARQAAGARADAARRRAHGDLHVRLDRRSQGGGADARKRGVADPRDRCPAAPVARRRGAGRAAVLPLLRVHDDAVDTADARPGRRLPHRPAGRAGRGAAGPRVPCHAPHGHAHVPADLHDFSTLEAVFGSAERLPREVSDAFEKRFGVRPSEAYGATELSPLVAANVPAARHVPGRPVAAREGTVGRPVLGCRARITDRDGRRELPVGEEGMLWISGPNVMQGYLDRPDLTAKVVQDGWYCTGDIARLDAEGFITITGRESRFSKIGGEMVPHLTIEEAINEALGAADGELLAVVTSVPDAAKGERLVVFHLPTSRDPASVVAALLQRGLPKLWVPSADSFAEIAEMPLLGSGKLDLRRLAETARARFGVGAGG
ncbi:MAG: hypothetical protein EBX36_09795 [Planctomycetia bacterium]|nr:hypothetical protein [Planctomycetia bacterium]